MLTQVLLFFWLAVETAASVSSSIATQVLRTGIESGWGHLLRSTCLAGAIGPLQKAEAHFARVVPAATSHPKPLPVKKGRGDKRAALPPATTML